MMPLVYTDQVTDSPDWQSFPNAQSDNIFTSFTQTLTPGTHSTKVIPALSWSSIMIAVSASAGAAQVQLNHYADAAATEQIDSDNWPFNASTDVRVRSPVRGKYVRIDLIITSATSATLQTWANFLASSSDRISFPVSAQNLSDYDHALAASGTQTYQSGEIAAGRALFYFKPYDATAKLAVSIHAVDELGNAGELIADFGSPAALTQQVIEVPDVILEVEVDNNDTVAAHSYDFALTIPPQ